MSLQAQWSLKSWDKHQISVQSYCGKAVGAKAESREELKGAGGGSGRVDNHYVLAVE